MKARGLCAHSGLRAGEHSRRAFDASDGDPPGYRDPTPREIWERRIEVHEIRGETDVADELRRRGPPADQRFRPLDDDETDCPGLTPIACLTGLHGRTIEALEHHGVLYAGELCGFTVQQLRRIPCIGDVTIRDLQAVLAPLGLALRGESPPRVGPPAVVTGLAVGA